MDCEICGDEEAEFRISIEGAVLNACQGCSKMGTVLENLRAAREAAERAAAGKQYPSAQAAAAAAEPEPEVVEDYGGRIRKAMERLKLSAAVLAERISEKESYLKRIEKGESEPTEPVARKLEDELDIMLFEIRESGHSDAAPGGRALTMADLLDFEMEKGKEKKKKTQNSETRDSRP